MLARGRHAHLAIDAVLSGDLRVQEHARQPEHDPVSAPIRKVQMRVVVMLHQLVRTAFEVTPVVLVSEAGGGDPGPR